MWTLAHVIVIDSEVTKQRKFQGFTFEFAKYFRLDQLNEVSIGNVITMEKNTLMDAVGGRASALPRQLEIT
ncbi:MAG: hypothetical protein GY762_00040 [Proteobacteria bacterium]|nr:hypothetical protein [Pseudomonadota bacterium]